MSAPTNVDVMEAYRLRVSAGLTYQQIGDLQGVSKQAVSQALYRFRDSLPSTDEIAKYEHAKSSLMSVVEERLLASCGDEEAISKSSLLDRSRAFKALHTSLRLEKELSTQNVSTKMSLLISQADQNLFSQAGTEADTCLEKEQAVMETSSKDINGLESKV